MARIELLNTETHRSLRIRTEPDPQRGDGGHFVRLVPSEFGAAAAHHPILFAKDAENGALFAGAVMGLDAGENLFLRQGRHSGYRPLASRREPFFIMGENLALDLDHPRVDREAGEALFEDDGRPSPFLRQMQSTLAQLKRGTDEMAEFVATLLRLDLIEPIEISLNFDDGEQRRPKGVYTISADNLVELDDANALMLFRRGYLHLAYTVIDSLGQIPVLARMRNDRLLAG